MQIAIVVHKQTTPQPLEVKSKKPDPDENPIEKLSQKQKIALVAGNFLLIWACFELWGSSVLKNSDQDWQKNIDLFNNTCLPSPGLACFGSVISMVGYWTLNYPIKLAYEKVGSFGMTAGLFTIPAIIATNMKENSAKDSSHSQNEMTQDTKIPSTSK